MGIFSNLLGKKEVKINSYSDFWNWFQTKQHQFYSAINAQENIEKDFFNPLGEKLNELREGFFFLAGMFDETTAELIITADGKIENMVFIEELIAEAPSLNNWKFTAFKPAMGIENLGISMNGHSFNWENLFFSPLESAEFPDEISVRVYHEDMTPSNEGEIRTGTFIFLDNFLGELEFANSIDTITIEAKSSVTNETIHPIAKLKDYINWRQKEFTEKYEGTWYTLDDNEYTLFEAKLENGDAILATINSELLLWDAKASHPWVSIVTIYYDGSQYNGMPSKEDYTFMDTTEDELNALLHPAQGDLNIGRETGQDQRQLFFASKDFRNISKVLDHFVQQYQDKFEIDLAIYKDKYWQSYAQYIRN
ncbi:MAG: DUF695 domain-containing protein [Fluviicola sp.]